MPANAGLAINPCNANKPKPVEHCVSMARRLIGSRFSVLGLFMVKLFVQVFDKSSDFRACQSGLFIKFIKFYLVAIALIQRDVQLALHFASGSLGLL